MFFEGICPYKLTTTPDGACILSYLDSITHKGQLEVASEDRTNHWDKSLCTRLEVETN